MTFDKDSKVDSLDLPLPIVWSDLLNPRIRLTSKAVQALRLQRLTEDSLLLCDKKREVDNQIRRLLTEMGR
jgi:hypothetical protein